MKKQLIAAIGTAFALGAASVMAQASGKLEAVSPEGRDITIAGKKLSVSGSRTKITIANKEATRGQLKAGMQCQVAVKDDEASKIDCK